MIALFVKKIKRNNSLFLFFLHFASKNKLFFFSTIMNTAASQICYGCVSIKGVLLTMFGFFIFVSIAQSYEHPPENGAKIQSSGKNEEDVFDLTKPLLDLPQQSKSCDDESSNYSKRTTFLTENKLYLLLLKWFRLIFTEIRLDQSTTLLPNDDDSRFFGPKTTMMIGLVDLIPFIIILIVCSSIIFIVWKLMNTYVV